MKRGILGSTGTLIELQAVKNLREEFTRAYRTAPDAPETREVYTRLMTLYMSLNVDAVLEVLRKRAG